MAWYDEENRLESAFPEWSLAGRNAVVEPGGTLIVRFLPHPNVADLLGDKEDVPDYPERAGRPFTHINTHWYSTVSGGRRRVLCPRTAPDSFVLSSRECELCKLDVRIDRRVAVNTYVIRGQTGQLIASESGLPEVRLMLLSRRIYDDVLSMIRGPFSVGDVTHPFTGRHISMTRPAKQTEPWRLRAEPKPSRISVPDRPGSVVSFIRSLTPPDKILEEAVAKQRIDGIDIDMTLEYNRREPGSTLGPSTVGGSTTTSSGIPF